MPQSKDLDGFERFRRGWRKAGTTTRPEPWAGRKGVFEGMDSFELNKIIGATLGTVFAVMTLGIVSDSIFAAPVPEKPGFIIEAQEDGGGDTGGPAVVESILPLLAGANLENGKAQEKKCAACHTIDKGGANKTGPNLYGLVDRPIGTHEGFAYSNAMKDFSKGGAEKWTYEHLDHFLLNPKGYIKGTAMGFAGLKKTQDRADLIAYLRTLADTEAPLPTAEATPAAQPASAEGAAPAAAPAGGATPAEGAAPAAPAEGSAPAPAESAAPAAPAEGATPAPAEPAPAN